MLSWPGSRGLVCCEIWVIVGFETLGCDKQAVLWMTTQRVGKGILGGEWLPSVESEGQSNPSGVKMQSHLFVRRS